MTGGHSPDRTDEMDFNTAQGLINFYLVHGRGPDKGDPVTPPRGGPETEALVRAAVSAVPSKQSFLEDVAHAASSAVSTVVHAAEQVPIYGQAVHLVGEVYGTPIRLADSIASGARLDHALVGELKNQLKIAKEAAPYAQTVVALVPGIGTGVAAAIGAGAALAEGQSITEAAKAAIRGAVPGGAIGAAAYDTALKVAAGENVGQAALESARALIPAGPGQKAFDIGLAVATGEKIQTALAKGLMSIAPGQLQTILAAGEKALSSTPGLAEAVKSVAPGAAAEGFQLAAGLLSHSGINEKALTAARSVLPADVRQGFDTMLKTQESHLTWLKNVTSAPVAPRAPAALEPPKRAPAASAAPAQPAPQALEPPKRATAPAGTPQPLTPPARAPGAAVRYAPYPKHMGALSGPPPTCRSLGDPISNMPHAMRNAGLSAVNGSGGRSRMVHGPDGNDYLFALEGGVLTARQCFSEGTLNAPPHDGHGHGGGGHGGHAHPAARPFMRGGRGGRGWGGPWAYEVIGTATCRTWGDPIDMTADMASSANAALGGSGGRPTTVRGPDNVLYLFTLENGVPTARPCASAASM
jgi:hypothetical protein